MYQQYNQCQQPAASSQQTYASQQPVQASTAGMVWNGTAWVNNDNSNSTQIPDNPVQTFTKYYHEWTAREKQLGEEIANLSHSGLPFADQLQQRQQLENEKQWAKYYADESSRAAHHFYQNPNAQEAPFALPKAPPSMQQAPPPPPPPPPKNNTNTIGSPNDAPTPGSLTRFLKRNLANCSSEQEKKYVQAEMEKRIACAIQEGTLQSKNWDVEPLIMAMNGNANNGNYAQQAQLQQGVPYYGNQIQNNNSSQSGYYGAAPASASPSNAAGYYGPSAGAPSTYAAAAGSNNRGSYYGPSQGASAPSSSSHNIPHDAFSYYGNPDRSSTSLSPSSSSHSPQNKKSKKNKKRQFDNGTEDFLALPKVSNQKYKKQRNHQLVRRSDSDGMDTSAEALAKRANRFAATGYVDESVHNSYTTHDKYMGKGTIGGNSNVELAETDFEQMTVKGTCQVLEKEYLRLTAPPRPERVRPLPILRQHLQNLKAEYYRLNGDKGNEALMNERERTPRDQWKYDDDHGNEKRRRHDYLWFCSQLKAVRQDCTVQRIHGDFAVDVYETHARIALQEDDLNE